jgi:sigma-B regulation protein RsbU (phosphoserine phosphatase)
VLENLTARSLAGAKSLFKRLGRLEKLFAILLLLYVFLTYATPGSGFVALLQVILVLLGLWIVIRLARIGIRRAIWRLRNRLLMTYLFIAVVPILLIVVFVGIGTYALSSQLAVYLVSSELDRRIGSLNWIGHAVSDASTQQRMQVLQGVGEVLRQRVTDPSIVLRQRDVVTHWPTAKAADPAPAGWADANGILVRDGRFYAWTHVVHGDTDVTITAPLTRAYLSDLMPDLGDVSLFVLSNDPRAPRSERLREETTNRLGPPENRLDVDLLGGSLMPFSYWDVPGKVQTDALISVHTRPSALLKTIFNAKVDAVQQFIPVALFGVAILFLLVEASSLVVGVSLARTITAAVHQLYKGTQRVMEGDFTHRIKVSKSRDQLAELSASFNTMTENLERLLDVAKEKERLQTELEIAREVQEQLYPKEIPAMKTVRLTAFWQSARIVSGDYFDYQRIGENQLALAIGDVAGKGISAALLMATIQSAMRMEVRGALAMAAPGGTVVNRLSPAQVVSDLNQQLHQTTQTEKFATFCFGIYDEQKGLFTYTNAGHLPPILVHNGASTRLDVNGMVVGAFPFAQYDESKVRLQPGDMLVFFTDGITEPENEYGEMFGEDRLAALFVKNADRPEEEIIKKVMDAVGQWSIAPERQDDMTLLVARRL